MKIFKHNLTFSRTIQLATFLIAVVAILVSILVAKSSSKSETNLLLKQETIQTIKAFIVDLEKIKNIAPTDPKLSDCISTRTGNDFNQIYSECGLGMHREQDKTRDLLERNKSALRLQLDDTSYEKILDHIKIIDFTLYEMENNQFIQEYRKYNKCPEGKFNKELGDTSKLKKDKDGNLLCTFVLLDYEYIIENDIEYSDRDKIRESLKRQDELGAITNPPDPENVSLEEYLTGVNNYLYSLMINQINATISDLKVIIS